MNEQSSRGLLLTGEFSRVASLSVKALRIYHEEGLLVPEHVDAVTGYRYYGAESVRRARTISLLKELGFSVKEMRGILDSCADDADLAQVLKSRLASVDRELARIRSVRDRILVFLETGKESTMESNFEIEERTLESITVCSIRFKGAYSDIGTRFGELFRKAGRWISGAPLALYWDSDYRDADADIEACVVVKKTVAIECVACRTLEGGKAVCLKHQGPYETVGDSYGRLFDRLRELGLEARTPSREVYLRGPGMILPRSPKKFITEIQMLI